MREALDDLKLEAVKTILPSSLSSALSVLRVVGIESDYLSSSSIIFFWASSSNFKNSPSSVILSLKEESLIWLRLKIRMAYNLEMLFKGS